MTELDIIFDKIYSHIYKYVHTIIDNKNKYYVLCIIIFIFYLNVISNNYNLFKVNDFIS